MDLIFLGVIFFEGVKMDLMEHDARKLRIVEHYSMSNRASKSTRQNLQEDDQQRWDLATIGCSGQKLEQ